MWKCPKCKRIFQKQAQPHSCRRASLAQHFSNKVAIRKIFDHLLAKLNANVGKCEIISIPCCIHLFGQYDFLAALPKKDKLEIRFALNRILKSSRVKQSVPLSKHSFKNCIYINSKKDINSELLGWLKESYYLKSK